MNCSVLAFAPAAVAPVVAVVALALFGDAGGAAESVAPVPATLRETGLYADWDQKLIGPGIVEFAPQYPLWTDGARKRRWIQLPAGTAIDASDVDAWRFPVGTRLWKELSFGRRVETRYMERLATGWRFATYQWTSDETEAVLAPARGVIVPGAAIEGGPVAGYEIPGEADCRACHDGDDPVLGFSALQLSPDRDPLALHASEAPEASELPALVDRGLVRGLPDRWLEQPPRIAGRTPTERASLGYLHGNCGGCHRADGALASLGMTLAYSLDAEGADAIRTTVEQPSLFVPAGSAATVRIAPGDPSGSVLHRRLRARDPVTQMPPLGSRVVDDEAVALLERWITELGAVPTSR